MKNRFRSLTLISSFLLFLFLNADLFSEQIRIGEVTYTLEKTRENDLKRTVPVDTERIFESEEEFNQYSADLKQRLLNTRAFDSVEIIIQDNTFSKGESLPPGLSPETVFDTPPSPEGEAPSNSPRVCAVKIICHDTKSLLILPYPKYDSNNGLIFKVKVKDVNFLGTMNPLDIGAFAGLKEDVESGDQNLTLGAEFKYRYPFYTGNILGSWNNNFEIEYTRGVNELEFWSGTGFTFERPFKRFSLLFDFCEQFNRDLEYEDFDDVQYFTSDLEFSVPIKLFNIENWGGVYWSPFTDAKINYDKNGIDSRNDDLAGPVISAGQELSTKRINWYGNFRTGLSLKAGCSIGYDFMQNETEPKIYAEAQAFKGFKYIGFNARLSSFLTKSNRGEVGSLIRGVRDEQKYLNNDGKWLCTKKALKTPSAIVLNIDIPVHIVTTRWLDWLDFIFGENSWFSQTFSWTDKFNFELQMSPFLDVALTKNEITDRLFSPKDGWYTGGVEFLCFPERWKGIVMRASVGVDLGRAVISKKYPGKIDMSWRENVKKYEIYAGIGLLY